MCSHANTLGISNIMDPCLKRQERDPAGAIAADEQEPCPSDASELPVRLNAATPAPTASQGVHDVQLTGNFQGRHADPRQYFFYDHVSRPAHFLRPCEQASTSFTTWGFLPILLPCRCIPLQQYITMLPDP